jgi:hypothetical protein
VCAATSTPCQLGCLFWPRAGGSLKPYGVPKEWDLFYSNQGGDWNDFARNWTLAKASFKRLILELGVKVGLRWLSAFPN